MAVDYEIYAEGEALLGWLNATVALRATTAFDGNLALREFAAALQSRLMAAGAEIAHLKMTLDPDGGIGDLAVINLVRNDYVAELSQELQDALESGQLIVNIRAEVGAEVLKSAVDESLKSCFGEGRAAKASLEHLEFFQPGKPQPTHRIAIP